jgi:hypothetical protein
MSEGVEFFAEVLMLVSSLGGLFGLTFYLGYRAGQRNPVAQLAEAINQLAENHSVAMKALLERRVGPPPTEGEAMEYTPEDQRPALFTLTRVNVKEDDKPKEEEDAIPEA